MCADGEAGNHATNRVTENGQRGPRGLFGHIRSQLLAQFCRQGGADEAEFCFVRGFVHHAFSMEAGQQIGSIMRKAEHGIPAAVADEFSKFAYEKIETVA